MQLTNDRYVRGYQSAAWGPVDMLTTSEWQKAKSELESAAGRVHDRKTRGLASNLTLAAVGVFFAAVASEADRPYVRADSFRNELIARSAVRYRRLDRRLALTVTVLVAVFIAGILAGHRL
jgi:hypothetical protein